jgi:vancomycin resistance protein YoaR
VHTEATDVHASASLHHVKRIGRQLLITSLVHRKVGVRAQWSQGIGRHKVTAASSQQTIHKLARGNTTLTANTTGRIDKNRFAHFVNILDRRGKNKESTASSLLRWICMHARCRETQQGGG